MPSTPDTSKPGPRMQPPDHVHPLVKLAYKEMAWQELSYPRLAKMSGVKEQTIQNWRKANSPTLVNIEACLNALGYDLVAVPKEKRE